ncbi:hypothetical protein GGI05_004722, partial [Coemansia sp. RSA 2603]
MDLTDDRVESASSRQGRQITGRAKQYEPTRNRRQTLNLTPSTPRNTRSTPAVPDSSNESSGSNLAKRKGPKSPEFSNKPTPSFALTARNAAQRAAMEIAIEPDDQVMEIHSDHSSESETLVRGKVTKPASALSSLTSKVFGTPEKSTKTGVSRLSDFSSVIKGFEDGYTPPGTRLTSLNTRNLQPGMVRSRLSGAKASILVADSPLASPTRGTWLHSSLVSGMRPKSSKVNDDDRDDFVTSHSSTNIRGVKRRVRDTDAVLSTESAVKEEIPFSSKSARQQTASSFTNWYQEERPMERHISVPETPPTTLSAK